MIRNALCRNLFVIGGLLALALAATAEEGRLVTVSAAPGREAMVRVVWPGEPPAIGSRVTIFLPAEAKEQAVVAAEGVVVEVKNEVDGRFTLIRTTPVLPLNLGYTVVIAPPAVAAAQIATPVATPISPPQAEGPAVAQPARTWKIPAGFSPVDIDIDPPSGLPTRIRHDATGYEMLLVPGGDFSMGSADNDPHAEADEKPQHRVSLEPFWIGVTPVFNKHFLSFRAWHTTSGRMKSASQPVTGVNWQAAADWCAWAGMRLPTEAEWEKAAGGGGEWRQSRRIPLSDVLVPPTVALRPGPSLGKLQLIGVVKEWCADWYAPNYYREAPDVNPAGPARGDKKVLRGSSIQFFRVAQRGRMEPESRMSTIGFRAVVSPK